MWWNYLIPDILDTSCYYLSIRRRKQHINKENTSADLISYISNNYTNNSQSVLDKYGNLPIKSLTIYRTPIANILETVLNGLTFGKWNYLKKKFEIDTFFHLSLIANIDYDGVNKNIIIEKNELINISANYDKNAFIHSQKMCIDIEKLRSRNVALTIKNLLENTRRKVDDDKFFLYDAFENNCQIFIKNILKHNKLYNKTCNTFLNQDISRFLSHIPYYSKRIINFSTNSFAVIQNIIQKI